MQIVKGVVEIATGENLGKPEASKPESTKKPQPADKRKRAN
jgi:hypothetical protein